jgi:uncharacterized surface protein with fasciclin (FAS1) repeats
MPMKNNNNKTISRFNNSPKFAMSDSGSGTDNIVTIASSMADFSTLVTAIKAANLVNTLSGTGPFTVFAPTNDAFDNLESGLLDKLIKPENKDVLTKILTYHVLSGMNDAAAVLELDGETVDTVQGESIQIDIVNDMVVLNDSVNVTKADVMASNGIIHVIDQVLVPSDIELDELM